MRLRDWLGGVLAIARRELLSLLVTPLGYLVATLFLLLQGWDFALLLRVLNDPLAAPGPPMQYYFGGSFFIFWLPVIFLCAALSMRLVAEERSRGTLESLLTTAVAPSQVVVGKYLAAFGFYVGLWVPTGVFYILLRGASVTPDPGPVASGYLGTALVGASFLAVGLLASSLARSQLGAAITTFVACTIALLSGLLVDQVRSEPLSQMLAQTSLLSMMQELAQGIVDGRWLWLHGGVVVSALALAVVGVDPRRTRERLLQTGLLVFAVGHLAVFGMRHSDRGDWTRGEVYSLSERARERLRALTGPVDVTVLVPSTLGGGRSNPVAKELREVLRRMAGVSDALRIRFLDPDRDRQEAAQLVDEFGIAGRELADGVVLVRAGQGKQLRKTHLYPDDLVVYATGPDVKVTGPRLEAFRGEEALLSAFVEVSNPRDLLACVTQGHGEPDLDSFEPFGGYARLEQLMEDAGIRVQAADLRGPKQLSGCDVVVVAGPQGPLPPVHVEAIEAHAENGGALLLLTGAVVLRGRTELARHGLEPLAARYGVAFGERVVLDPHPMAGGTPLLSFTITDGWGEHPAVRPLLGRPVSLILARELSLTSAEGTSTSRLLQVGEQAWAETDLTELLAGAEPQFDARSDRRGPIPVAVAAQRGSSRLAVIASDQFALNAHLRPDVAYDHGRDLILNVLGWLTERPALAGLRPKQREHVKLVLLPGQLARMTLVCVVGLPAFALLLGVSVLWRRRR